MIIASAVKHDGKIYLGRGHCFIMQWMYEEFHISHIKQQEQGFYTEDGEYLDRETAKWWAIAYGQVKKENLICSTFTSEEIWKDLDPIFRIVEC